MRTTLTLLACIFLIAITGCEIPASFGNRADSALSNTAAALDRNSDGVVTNREIKDSKNDPTFWIGIAGAVMGLLGLKKSASVGAETDDQWERLAKLESSLPDKKAT